MKKIMPRIIAMIMGVMAVMGCLVQPVWAACTEDQLHNGCVNTAILGDNGCLCDTDQNGEQTGGGIVLRILSLVINILTVGVGVLGVIGITVVGIQYLTAGGSEEKTRKAKQRMLEIVIGLVAYVLIFALLKWLLPTV